MIYAENRLYPLTSPQREIWFDQLLHEGIPLNNIGGYVKICGAIDSQLFEQAVNLLVQKHDNLRTVLIEVDGEDGLPMQTYAEKLTVSIPVHDFSTDMHPPEVAIAWMQQRFIEPFEFIGQPLFRYDLVKISADYYCWLVQYHYLIIDDYSIALLNRSLAEIYTQLANGQPPNLDSPSYLAFVDNDHTYVESESFKKQQQYWLDIYPVPPEPLFSPRYRSNYTNNLISSGCEVLYLPRDFCNHLNVLAKQYKVTLFHLLLGAFYVYLTRIAQRDDFVIGLPVLNRANFKKTAGLFKSMSPVLFNFGKDLSFTELLQQINKTLKTNYRYQRFPVSKINQAVGLSSERSQLFDISLSYESHDNDTCFAGIDTQFIPLLNNYEQIPLNIFVRDTHNDVKLDFVFNFAYFNAGDIKALQARLVIILEAALKDSLSPIYALPIMTEQEIKQLQAWNNTATDYPKDKTIIDLFEEQVEKTPNNIAVVFEDQQLTYQQLNQKANQLAHYILELKTDNGSLITGNCLIAIAVERSLEMVIGLLGILKAGSAYVPIDPSYPPARISYMLNDCAAPLLLTQSLIKAQLLRELEHVVVCLDEVDFAKQPLENPLVRNKASDLAYVIYTSGSTGNPKGAINTHTGIMNRLLWMQDTYQLTFQDRILQKTPFSFDVSVWEFFWPFITGAGLVVAKPEGHKDPAYLASIINTYKVTTLHFVPSMLQVFLNHADVDNCRSLKLVICSGEALSIKLIKQFFANFAELKIELHNLYGPTEATIDVSHWPCKIEVAHTSVPIGKPVANTQLYILDANHQIVPIGVQGELCIAGIQVGRGYLNRPKLTAEKFIEVELFDKVERIYKTGDLARWLPDGNLEYLGRIDHQIKLRGFRIELGEIEAVISKHLIVKEVVVTLYEADDNKQLVAYLTVKSEKSDDFSLVAELKDTLKASLPDYMVPSYFTVLDKLPLTPNGKIDRKALPAPKIETSTGTKPKTLTEDLLAGLMAHILKREAVNREDNFFELGGHSLLATQLIARIRDNFQIELPIQSVFDHPQLSTLATAIETATGTISLPTIEAQSEDTPKILSYAQQRLWFLNQFEDTATYNLPEALQLSGQLNIAALQQSLHWLQERHASLRTYFPTHAGKATVQIRPIDEIEVPVHDLRLLSDKEQSEAVQNRANTHAITPFDLDNGPLFKAVLLQLNDELSVLLLNTHHIISDGWSKSVFIQDWQHAYTAFAQGKKPSLPPLTIQYTDYAAWQRNWLQGEVLQQQVDYWMKQLSGIPELLELPTDKPRPPKQSYQGTRYVHQLSATLTKSITALSQQHGVTVFMTLLASFSVLLSRYSRQNDICIGSPIANRTLSQIEDLIGFFVNTLVLRSQLSTENQPQNCIDLLLKTRQTCLEAYAHQDIPFEMLVEQLQPSRSLSYHPLFQVMFVLQNNEETQLKLPNIDITALSSEYPIAKFDLTLNMEDQNGQLKCEWEYATDLFEAKTIERMAKHFEVLLTAIVANPAQSVSQLPMLTEAEIYQLQTWNNTATDYPTDKTIVDLFEQQVEKTPNNIAVVFENQQLTYQQLNEKANQLAHHILTLKHQAKISSSNPLIAIVVERSMEMVIGLLGILKAGGAYVPIDPSYPVARIRYMLDDCAVPLLLTQNHLKIQLSLAESGLAVICLDEMDFTEQPSENIAIQYQAEDLAYVIYTSGSTGGPKGVMVEQRNLFNSTLARQDYYYNDIRTRLLLLPSFAFDAFGAGTFLTLTNGGSLYLPKYPNDIDKLATIILEHKISHFICTPTIYQELLEHKPFDSLTTIILGGEVASQSLLQQHFTKIPQASLFNEYGPTEATIWSTVFHYQTQNEASNIIGQPIANTSIYILNAQHQLQPIGIPGELCIAGRNLARGYLNRSESSTEKFIEVKLFGKIERIYKTGDLARLLPDGNLEYLGRIDHQIKLRGFRIELGEIEAVLSQHEAVKEAVVILYEKNDNKRLVAYVTVESEKLKVKNEKFDNLSAELNDWLKAQLPDYMIPSHFTVLDYLPLTPNGKIDRKALPAPELNLTETYEAPRNDIEQQLAQVWSSLLNQNNISIHDNFFSLGGDSILSIQIVARARQAGLHFTPSDLFEYQTIAELATVVSFGVVVNAEQGLITGECLLTPIQYWFFAQDFPEYWHLNQSILLRVPLNLDVDALGKALAAVLSHHDALRLRYHRVNGNWQQFFTPPQDKVPLFIEDLSQCENSAAELHRLTQNYQTSFNLTSGPLTNIVLFKLADSARLFWCIHHLVVDGVSWRILQEDLHTAYTQIAANQPIKLPAKTSSFKAWAQHLNSYAASEILASELAYWQALPTFSLPVDNPSGKNRLEHYQDYTITLSNKETEALLRNVPKAYNTRINDILLTALALTLTEWTGKSSCLIDLEGHGRVTTLESKALDLSRTVGWFTTIHPIALTLPTSLHSDLGATIKAVKEQLRAVPNEGIGYGLLSQLNGKVLPKGEILFNYLGQFDQGIKADLFDFAEETTNSDISLKGRRDHLIDINGDISQGQLKLTWDYSGDCFQVETIKNLAENYKNHLQRLIIHCQKGQQGITPSDFPLAPVSQSTLDTLYTQYPGLQDLYLLSPMQQGMLFHALYEPETGIYFVQIKLTLTNLEPAIFKAAWQHQLERHPILRSAFLPEHQPVLQVVQTEVSLPWREHDWRGMAAETQDSQLDVLLQQERSKGFNLNQAPLIRFDLIRLDEQRHKFILHHHHIIMDGWCLPIIFSEVRNSYLAFKQERTPPLPILRPYRDYIAWLQQPDTTDAQHYWQQRLAGFTAPTPLPIIEYKTESPIYTEVNYSLDVETSQHLQSFCQAQRVTLNTLIQGAWALLLSRYSRETDLCFGVTVSGRNASLTGIDQMVGLFINTLPLRIDTNPEYCVKDYLQQIQIQHQNDNRYAHSPLFEIQANSDIPSNTALFESLLVFENYPLGDYLELSTACYQIENIDAIEYNNYPLTVDVVLEESLNFKVTYDSNRISFESIERLWGHLSTLLNAIVANPAQSISNLPMLTETEVQQLQTWNETATDYPNEQTIIDLFEQQVEKNPNNIAVVFEDQQLTYQQLNQEANRLAHYLLKLKNGTGEFLIAVVVKRSLEMVTSLLAILKAGAAYVPIDPSYPAARIRYMLNDCAAKLLLTQNQLKAQLPLAEFECIVVCLDDADFISQSIENPNITHRADDLAYVIYTSGTTGKPKGAMVEHRGMLNHIYAKIDDLKLNGTDTIAHTASLTFDISVWQAFALLALGGSVQVFSEQIVREPRILLDSVVNEGITILEIVPSLLRAILPEINASPSHPNLSSLRWMVLTGEALPPDLCIEWFAHYPKIPLFNAYGPTECSDDVAHHPIYQAPALQITQMPIGKPVNNMCLYVLDKHLQLLPVGIAGELYVAGIGVGRGYWNAPEKTAQAFIDNPFTPEERLYKTGDLVRWLPDGNLEYLGRIDHQIKLRGFRIELGEIEAVLNQHPAVKEAVVILYETDDNKQLVAYVTVESEKFDDLLAELKDTLKLSLPDYMIPNHFIVLEHLPLTPNGKIDRKALPTPEVEISAGTKPQTPTEELLAELWTNVLKREAINREDNFFELGGHSLLATQLVTRIRDSFKIELPVRSIFEHPQLANLAVAIEASSIVVQEISTITETSELEDEQHEIGRL